MVLVGGGAVFWGLRFLGSSLADHAVQTLAPAPKKVGLKFRNACRQPRGGLTEGVEVFWVFQLPKGSL